MTIGYKDSQSAIEQKRTTHIVGVCLLYFNLFEFDWFFENTIS